MSDRKPGSAMRSERQVDLRSGRRSKREFRPERVEAVRRRLLQGAYDDPAVDRAVGEILAPLFRHVIDP